MGSLPEEENAWSIHIQWCHRNTWRCIYASAVKDSKRDGIEKGTNVFKGFTCNAKVPLISGHCQLVYVLVSTFLKVYCRSCLRSLQLQSSEGMNLMIKWNWNKTWFHCMNCTGTQLFWEVNKDKNKNKIKNEYLLIYCFKINKVTDQRPR